MAAVSIRFLWTVDTRIVLEKKTKLWSCPENVSNLKISSQSCTISSSYIVKNAVAYCSDDTIRFYAASCQRLLMLASFFFYALYLVLCVVSCYGDMFSQGVLWKPQVFGSCAADCITSASVHPLTRIQSLVSIGLGFTWWRDSAETANTESRYMLYSPL